MLSLRCGEDAVYMDGGDEEYGTGLANTEVGGLGYPGDDTGISNTPCYSQISSQTLQRS
jgi:hypothetical protein